MRRYAEIEKRIARLSPEPEWQDNDSDNFLTSIDALPGESAQDALRRQAPIVWANHSFPEGEINDDE